jgi:phenylalanyl-tRNA synthetase beta chain
VHVPLSWLAEFVTWEVPIAVLVDRMTMSGLKVEATQEVGDLDARIRVARIEAFEPHPGADRLAVCRLDVGGERRTVVSAAPGLTTGQRVAVALVGARLPSGRTVERRCAVSARRVVHGSES